VAGLAAAALGTSAQAQLRIELSSNTALEQRGREQLERLLRTYDLSPWLFTSAVRIESYVIPHSHPVLTRLKRVLRSHGLVVNPGKASHGDTARSPGQRR